MPFLNFTGRANALLYIKNLVKDLSFEEENDFFHQAIQSNNFQQINEWRSDLPKGMRFLNQLISRKIHPLILRKQLLIKLEQFEQTVLSPIYYHLYLQKLENKLAEETPWQYDYVLQEARARLREKIKANPDLAVTYLHNDMSYQLARLSGNQIQLKLLEQTLAYYKRLVPEDYYVAMKKLLDTFVVRYATHRNTEKTYSDLQNQFNGLVQAYFEPPEEEIEQTSVTFSWSQVIKGFMDVACHPQWVLLGMGMLLGQWTQVARLNSSANELVTGNYGEMLPSISPLLISGIMHNWKGRNQPLSAAQHVLPLTLSVLPLVQFAKAESVETFLTSFGWSDEDYGEVLNVQQTLNNGYIVARTTKTANDLFLVEWNSKGEIQ